jgi:hypothetical protein
MEKEEVKILKIKNVNKYLSVYLKDSIDTFLYPSYR